MNRALLAVYDRLYRLSHGLDHPRSAVDRALRVEVRRNRKVGRLRDGTAIARGDLVGVLHVNNAAVVGLHLNGLSPIAIGLEFRREVLASLAALAHLAAPGGRYDGVVAFTATTIFHRGLARLGFEIEEGGLVFPGIVAAYQRALLAYLHPSGVLRLAHAKYARSERLWISRQKLVVLYGARAHPRSLRDPTA